jgi:hypothetical protein
MINYLKLSDSKEETEVGGHIAVSLLHDKGVFPLLLHRPKIDRFNINHLTESTI